MLSLALSNSSCERFAFRNSLADCHCPFLISSKTSESPPQPTYLAKTSCSSFVAFLSSFSSVIKVSIALILLSSLSDGVRLSASVLASSLKFSAFISSFPGFSSAWLCCSIGVRKVLKALSSR